MAEDRLVQGVLSSASAWQAARVDAACRLQRRQGSPALDGIHATSNDANMHGGIHPLASALPVRAPPLRCARHTATLAIVRIGDNNQTIT